MVLTNEEKVRNTLQVHDKTVLTPRIIDQFISDAATQINVSDEIAERYYACFLIAESISWDKVAKIEGVTFNAPKPEKFKKLYTERLRGLGRGKMKKSNYEIVDDREY